VIASGDIGEPPTGHMSSFGVYVALSRSWRRGTIRLFQRETLQSPSFWGAGVGDDKTGKIGK
jgi:hypothetical protein